VKWLSDATIAHLGALAAGTSPDGGRYTLLEPIGQGGMGIVYRAWDRELDRAVALKVLPAAPATPDAQARLAREARIIARLEHPNIVPVHDCGLLPDGRFFYAMKLVRGRRLDEAADRPAAPAERLPVFQKICDAVAFAHAHDVLHRDLKPQNIMIGPFGEVLVMDWGIAKETGAERAASVPAASDEPGPDRTADGVIVGTPGYMAPEQARGEIADARADIHALGAILYYLLTGRTPERDRDGAVQAPRSHDRAIPRALEAICLKAIAADRAGRYGAVTDLSDDIAHFLAQRRVAAYREGILETGWRLATKYRVVLTLILAYVVMRVVFLLFAI
jgi:serine/threonine protein kinase